MREDTTTTATKKTSTIAEPFIVCNGLVDCLGLIWQWKLSISEWAMAFWVCTVTGMDWQSAVTNS
jgi:hypothetical protein